jgi:cytochrome c oxidase subunit 1
MTADARDRARALTLRYVFASTLILLASGFLGLMLRTSQAGYARVSDNTWYALMTAHGLGTFLGWAGFAVMGFTWWILAELQIPLRRFGWALAVVTWWLMVVGVAGVLVTTLFMHFGGSWVFLYPIPFFSAGKWSDTATGLFAGSVLLVGLSIVTWCLAVLDTVVGPALHAVSPKLLNRVGVALGFGYLWPKRFATNPEPVPYAVIPLTVIAIDMIIATLPLAVLLVEMIVQSIDPNVTVDPLLAKNILWWFGHPVVYLLLFPAAAIYYYLVPRLAGRALVAGNIIAVAWTIAVIANVLVWAHHVYLDYPNGTRQAVINTAMQPTTYALVIPSALSLYSLGFTIYRSSYAWNAAGTALFLGLVSWLLAGLSGIVNATIAFDRVVHNTLWVVGHFHQMALLNIGLAIFAAVYAFLPELVRKPLYSEALGKWHIWLTFVGQTAHSAIWLWQGLDGAPRRYAILPERYDTLTKLSVAVVLVIGFAQILFVINIVQTVRGAGFVPVEERRRRRPEAAFEAAVVLIGLGFAAAVGAIAFFVGRDTAPTKRVTVQAPATSTTAPPATGPGNAAAGKAVFASAGCGACHTLAAADAHGNVGPNLDQAKPSYALVLSRVTNGMNVMPSFKGQPTADQIRDVAAYVSSAAGRQ